MLSWETLDCHVGGEPLRLINQMPYPVEGENMAEKRENLKKDRLIQATIREPRGHEGMYAAVVTEPEHEGSAFGVLFACNDHGFPRFCGHAFLGTIWLMAHDKKIPDLQKGDNYISVDISRGTIQAVIRMKEQGTSGELEVETVSFISEPCFVFEEAIPISTENYGTIGVDLAWGGSFMAFVSSEVLPGTIGEQVIPEALKIGYEIGESLLKWKPELCHPVKSELRLGETGALICFIDPVSDGSKEGVLVSKTLNIIDRNVYDRGAAGTSTTARMALLAEKGVDISGKTLLNHSFTGSHYDAAWVRNGEDEQLKKAYVISRLSAEVCPMGKCSFELAPDDPFPDGFLS